MGGQSEAPLAFLSTQALLKHQNFLLLAHGM